MAEPEDHLCSADHSLRNAGIENPGSACYDSMQADVWKYKDENIDKYRNPSVCVYFNIISSKAPLMMCYF
jgi:hypothetical protein